MEAERDREDLESTELAARGQIELGPDEQIELIRFGDLQEGDVLIGSQGRTSVTEGFDTHTPEAMYVLETDSGIELEVSGNHLLYVVTSNDRDLHRKRLADGKKLGKSISRDSIEALQDLAEGEPGKEGAIAEFEHFIEPKSDELRATLLRVAEAIGPVSELQHYVDDLEGSEKPLFYGTLQNYDRRIFAQQLLSVLNIGKARKRWPIVVGTVLTAEMLAFYDPEDIYIPDPPEVL